jgi:serine/threonine protein kinase/tetratricopeptide (TPR) repeat protein
MSNPGSWLSRMFKGPKQDKVSEGDRPLGKGNTVMRPPADERLRSPEPEVEIHAQAEPLHEPPPWEVNRLLLNEYRVEGVLGEGGMGTVYLVARRTSDGERFAVKTLLSSVLADEQMNRLFMRELRTWIGLPEHPHITACRFFRTIESRLAIFAEYIEGGNLQGWIREKKLLGIENILDVAIQCAWGLEAAHVQGVVHQDMKPVNVLMTKGGIAKITDFGLAHARHQSGMEKLISGRPQSILVSAAGMTPAYCSPEQAAWQKLTHRTDTWSWGLTVLEMFTGTVTWPHGSLAQQALEKVTKDGSKPSFPRMPESVAAVLRRCFKEDPLQRWNSLGEAAEELRRIYRKESGKDYPRKKTELKTSIDAVGEIHDRRTVAGVKWDDPRKWLAKALRLSGRDPSDLEDILKEQKGSRKAQALLDLELYEQALKIYLDLVKQGRKEIDVELSRLYQHKAFVHENVADLPGAVAMYDRATEILDRLMTQESRSELANELATVYMNKALAVSALGDNRAAVELYDKAIQIRERLVSKESRSELANELARVYMNKALAVSALGDNRAAVELYDKAIQIRERLVSKESRSELASELAIVYMNKAVAVSALEDNRAAVELYDKAIQIYERLVAKEGRSELANELAMVYMNKANAVSDLGDKRAAVGLYDKAIQLRERLVSKEGRTELANELAMVYVNKAVAVSALGDKHAAVGLYDKAIQIRERLVSKEGRTELANGLANVFMNKANAVSILGDSRAAVGLYDKAIQIWERLVSKEGCTELLGDLCWVKLSKAVCLHNLGETQKAKKEAQAAIPVLRAEVKRKGRADLSNVLNWAETNLKMLLE